MAGNGQLAIGNWGVAWCVVLVGQGGLIRVPGVVGLVGRVEIVKLGGGPARTLRVQRAIVVVVVDEGSCCVRWPYPTVTLYSLVGRGQVGAMCGTCSFSTC